MEQAEQTVAEYQKQQSDPAYLARLKAFHNDEETPQVEPELQVEPEPQEELELQLDEVPQEEIEPVDQESPIEVEQEEEVIQQVVKEECLEDLTAEIINENTFISAQKIVEGKTQPGLGMATGLAGGIVGFYWLLMLVGRLIGASVGARVPSRVMLSFVSFTGIVLVLAAIFSSIETIVSMPAFDTSGGTLSVGMQQVPISFLFLALVGLCTSIMWGAIFNLAVEGLGKYVALASGIFMMLVVGGGIIPLVQNWIADLVGFMPSYWIIIAGLAYLLYYALIGSKNVNKDIPVD